jgi:hypothetical protein
MRYDGQRMGESLACTTDVLNDIIHPLIGWIGRTWHTEKSSMNKRGRLPTDKRELLSRSEMQAEIFEHEEHVRGPDRLAITGLSRNRKYWRTAPLQQRPMTL